MNKKANETAKTRDVSGPVKKGSPVKKGKSKIRISIRIKFSLAIIALVSIIIMTVTMYFIYREGDLLKIQAFQLVEREIIHLSNTARDSLGIDDLALKASIQDIMKVKSVNNTPYFKYAYILDNEGTIQEFFNLTDNHKIGDKFTENRSGSKVQTLGDGKILVMNYPDPDDSGGVVYDFSKTVPNKINTQQTIGKVIIGFSDRVIRDEVAEVTRVILLISLAFLGIAMIGSIILASIIIKPIKELSHGAAVIGQGDLDYRINIRSSDELGQLAREFNDMTSMIKEAKEKEIESRLMEEQIEIAREIQEGLNPMGYYEKDGIQIKGFTKAAKGVGGDYFDYINIDNYRVGALISDVSGKGVPASLVMVMIRTVFTSFITRKDIDCARVVRSINDSLSADFAIDKFATLFFMIYDRRTEELSFANAGHGPLFCFRSAKKACTLTKLEGTPIGIMEDVDYKQAKVKLNLGDIVIMYTDGVTEMRNEKKEEYGIRRVQELIMQESERNASELVEIIVGDVDKFRGNASPHDDMTLLVFKRIG